MEKKEKNSFIERPPVIVIVGHIDHGKSTLLDYIRKTNVVDKEAGGITQHLSAYEVLHKNEKGVEKKITFLDTPGHEAFQKMRSRSTDIADIAVLIVSAEDSVKAQTIEAYKSIKESGIPYVVAINKIDKTNANVERTKQNLIENEIYLEGLGGDVPWVAISSKSGEGIDELLDMMLLVSELEELKGDPTKPAEGVVIESHLDPQKGVSATLIIKDGTLKSGMVVATGDATAPVRIMEDFLGKQLKEASFSTPIQIIGFSKVPKVGTTFVSFSSKKDAENYAKGNTEKKMSSASAVEASEDEEEVATLPIVLKADVLGTIDAVMHEIEKIDHETIQIKVVKKGVGSISEDDVKVAQSKQGTIILGFNTTTDPRAKDLALRTDVQIETFDIIYKLSEWLEEHIQNNAPKRDVEETTGKAKILKTFSVVKDKQVLGGRVDEGELVVGNQIKILRGIDEIGRGKILGLQQQKIETKKIEAGNEFGAQLQSETAIQAGDHIECFTVVTK